MDSPNMNAGQQKMNNYMDISQERLDAMNSDELTRCMELALDSMTDETYDPTVIDAYLEALDRKSPMPKYKSSDEAYGELSSKLNAASIEAEEVPAVVRVARPKRLFKTALVAATLICCLFCGMIAAQAMGIDVFGAVASWTESVFSFREASPDVESYSSPDSSGLQTGSEIQSIPSEYNDIYSLLEERGLTKYMLSVPNGFELTDMLFDVRDTTGDISFIITYKNGDDYITYSIDQTSYNPNTTYEKSAESVMQYVHDEVTHYIFSNIDSSLAVWMIGDLEFCISSSLDSSELEKMVKLFYEE